MTRYGFELKTGEVFETQRRTLLESDVAWFAGWSWDTNPVHTDAVSATAGRYGSPIAHGMLGLSVTMGLISRLGVFEGSSVAMLGVEDWRFLRPLRAGDTVWVELEILSVRQASDTSTTVVDRRASLLTVDGVAQQGRLPLLMSTHPPS